MRPGSPELAIETLSAREELSAAADRVAARVMKTLPLWGGYTGEWALEALLIREAVHDKGRTVLNFALERGRLRGESLESVKPWERQPFVSTEWELAQRTDDERFLEPWLFETRRWRDEGPRTPEGLILHRTTNGRPVLLLDDLQEYALRCLRGGVWSGDLDLIEEGVSQWLGAERALRDSANGLWSQGRGFLRDAKALSPGAWSRGHGWLLRGLVSGMVALERDEALARLAPILDQVLLALAATQAESGAWHRLLHLPVGRSLPDASGTGMILHYVFQAWRRGWVTGHQAWAERLRKAALWMASCVDEVGAIARSCPGPGPLVSEEPYLLGGLESGPDEPHGPPALILAAAAGEDSDFPWMA